MSFDVPTVFALNIFIGIISICCLTILLKDKYQCPGISYWLSSQWCMTIGIILIIARLWLPLSLSGLAGNTLISMSISLVMIGFSAYHNTLSLKSFRWLIFPVLIFIGIGFCLISRQSLTTREIISDSLFIPQIFLCSYICLHSREKEESSRQLWACILFVGGIILSLRLINNSFYPLHESFFKTNLVNLLGIFDETLYLLGSAICIPIISSQWLQQQLTHHANYDLVTEIYNRRAMMELGNQLLQQIDRSSSTKISLALLDIDYFKKINDQYGHLVGDIVLKQVATLIQTNALETDLISRYGGEEFIALLPYKTSKQAKIWAEQVKNQIEEQTMIIDGHHINITVSMGLVEFQNPNNSLIETIHKADIALYQAKDNGRNQVVVFSSDLPLQKTN
ncbi:MAG: hypothetical protein CENE_00118 [Candidatus Celerinatantimonas neptuna]|nr:MAG: hypothetical protein CENE_00118 [Candidatus Celerinatantimonas neptuna]